MENEEVHRWTATLKLGGLRGLRVQHRCRVVLGTFRTKTAGLSGAGQPLEDGLSEGSVCGWLFGPKASDLCVVLVVGCFAGRMLEILAA